MCTVYGRLFTGVDVLFSPALLALHLAAPHKLAPEGKQRVSPELFRQMNIEMIDK